MVMFFFIVLVFNKDFCSCLLVMHMLCGFCLLQISQAENSLQPLGFASHALSERPPCFHLEASVDLNSGFCSFCARMSGAA